MEFKGQLVRKLLRILTPEEIADWTISSTGKKKVGLSLLLESNLNGEDYNEIMEKNQVDEDVSMSPKEIGEAKILPFDEEASEDESFTFQVGKRVHALLGQYGKVFLEMDKKVLGPKRFPKRKGTAKQQPTSSLIIEQKKKLHASYSKIKSMEVMSLYKDSIAAEINPNQEEDDFSFSAREGVLVNKKQA